MLTIPFNQRAASDPVTRKKCPIGNRRITRVPGQDLKLVLFLRSHQIVSTHSIRLIQGYPAPAIRLDACQPARMLSPIFHQVAVSRRPSPAYTISYGGCSSGGGLTWQRVLAACVLVGFGATIAIAQADTDGGKATPPAVEPTRTADTILTSQQETDLLNAEDQILHFVSKDTHLPIKSPVKCRFISREAVATELRKKFEQDKGAKRMERSELVLKKFGLLDESFKMRPFLLSLLTEQIAGFYDDKTKQMNLLDWVPIDEQKPVMAHELTHALQDQKVGLQKWGSQEIEGVAKNVKQDNLHIASDDTDTAREAVARRPGHGQLCRLHARPGRPSRQDPPRLPATRPAARIQRRRHVRFARAVARSARPPAVAAVSLHLRPGL